MPKKLRNFNQSNIEIEIRVTHPVSPPIQTETIRPIKHISISISISIYVYIATICMHIPEFRYAVNNFHLLLNILNTIIQNTILKFVFFKFKFP